MAALKRFAILALLATFTGCGQVTTTQVLTLETDTFLSSTDPSNHSELGYVRVSKSPSLEERGLVKLPTGKQDADDNIDTLLANPIAVVVDPFLVLVEVIARMLDCNTNVVRPEYLTSSHLVFSVQSTGATSPDHKVSLYLAAKPWFQTANWERAHAFSSKGRWQAPGGDWDSSFTAIPATYDAAASTLDFDITPYFKSLISQDGQAVHYGLLLVADSGGLDPVQLSSTQSLDGGAKPRVVSTYTGPCGGTYASDPRRVFYLGK